MINIYTDGAYSAVTKRGGWSFYCKEFNIKVCGSSTDPTTNNRMEMTAVLKALQFLEMANIHEKEVTIWSDSLYVINTMNNIYQKKTNCDLWHELDEAVHRLLFSKVYFKHVKGHAENKDNNTVDFLANLMSQQHAYTRTN